MKKFLIKFTLNSNGEVGEYKGSKIVNNIDNFKLTDNEKEEITGFRADFFRLIINDIKKL